MKTQTNVLGGTWNYFLAGARSEEVDPDGTRHLLYNNPSGKTAFDIQNYTPALPVSQWLMTSSTYDGQDRLVSQTAPEGNSTSYTYDLRSNVLTVTRTPKPGSGLSPLVTTSTYDPTFNKPLTITDPRGIVTANTYQAGTGNLLSTVADSGSGRFNATTRFTYNAFGLPLTVTDPMGVVTQNTYDDSNNVTSVVRDAGTGRLNQTTTYTFNARGDPLTVTNANGATTTSTYDDARRVLTVTTPATASTPGGLSTAYTYDTAGQVTQTQQKVQGTVLRTTSATYTLSGKTATATDANSNTTTFAYDLLDRLVRTTDAEKRVTTFSYDALGRRIAVFNPAISTVTPLAQQSFTLNGQRATLTDANSNVTSFAYDGFDRLTTTTYPNSSTTALSYDAESNVTLRCTRAGKPIAFTYDTLNRLGTKTLPGTAANCAATPNGVVTTFAYDLAGRTTGVSDTSPAIQAISTAGAPLAFTTSTTYDALNRPTGVSYNPAPAATTTPAAFSPVTFSHSYNKVNQRSGQSVSDNAWIDYPAAANGLCYTANTVNQYTQIRSVSGGSCSGAIISPTYDNNANLTSDGAGSFTYDAENRLVQANVGGTVTDYQFDGRGRRTKKQPDVGAGTIYVTGADNRELLEYDAANGTILRWYAYGLGPNDVVGQMNVGSSTRATFIPDMLGSVIGTQDAASGTITKFGYGTYGSSGAAPSNFAYTGQRIDQESGLYYYRARHYSPFLGRFNQTDPASYEAGMHLYAYADNDPLNLLDPFGLETQSGRGSWFGYGSFSNVASVMAQPYANIAQPLVSLYQAAVVQPFYGVVGALAGTPVADPGLWASLQGLGQPGALAAGAGRTFAYGVEYLATASAALRTTQTTGVVAISLRTAESWGNPATLARHFADHGADFGAAGASDYAAQASKFLQRSQVENLPTKIDAAGTIRTYDPASNTFGAYNANGTTRTFFRPTSPTYFDRQPGAAPTLIGGQ